ncbi:MAG: hypothetical protein ABR569_06130 [Gaiellaceae bacterium]
MNIAKRWIVAMVLAGSLAGGALGATVLSSASGSAATGTSTTSTNGSSSAPGGKFTPNENASHEAGESAQREAQEDAGQFPTVP